MQTKMKQETSEPHHSVFWTAETFPSHIQCSKETCSSTDIAKWKFLPSKNCQYQTSSTRQQWQPNRSKNDWRITKASRYSVAELRKTKWGQKRKYYCITVWGHYVPTSGTVHKVPIISFKKMKKVQKKTITVTASLVRSCTAGIEILVWCI